MFFRVGYQFVISQVVRGRQHVRINGVEKDYI
jgi:hypothetical protein